MKHPEWTLAHMLLNSVDRDPNHVAIVEGERSYTYADLLRQSSSLAQHLLEHGLERGDRVGVYLDKSWEAVVAIFAITGAGGVFVNINTQLKEAQIRHIMGNCAVRILIGESVKLADLSLPNVDVTFYRGDDAPATDWTGTAIPLTSALSANVPPFTGNAATQSDLGTIIYTSGSTGLPKGIMFTHHNIVVGAQIVSTYLKNTSEDRLLSVLPLNFDYGLNQLTTMVRVGGTLVLQRSLLPGDILRSLRQENITGLAGVPPVWTLLLQNRRSLNREPLQHLRYITNSGGMVPQVHLDELRTLLPSTEIFLMYGLTEAFRSTFLSPTVVDKDSSCIGKAIPDNDVWVVNAEGKETAPGEVGELIHHGPTIALGYWGDEEKTNAVYRPNPLAPPEMRQRDVVVYSGDLVTRDEDGYMYYVGRRDEQIKTEGFRVSPQEVEELLLTIPAVYEAIVFGEKDPLLGQRVVAVLSMNKGQYVTNDEIRAFCSERAPQYLIPRTIHITDDLPKTATGKIDRSGLKHAFARDEN